jgi:hypothetical protein
VPTSASTGTQQVQTRKKDTAEAKKAAKAAHPSSPDGAPVVTRPEDVVGGVRVDLEPSPPQDQEGPAPLADHNGVGIVQGTREDGSAFLIQQD